MGAREEREPCGAPTSNDAEATKQSLYLEMLLRYTPNSVLILDKDGRIDYCSDAFLRLANMRDNNAIRGMLYSEFYEMIGNREFVEAANQRFMDVHISHKPIETELRIAFPGGDGIRSYTIHSIPFFDGGGCFVGEKVLFYDTTAVKLAESNEYTRVMMNAAPQPCSLWDANGNILDCNRPMLDIIGLAQRPDKFSTERFLGNVPDIQPDGVRTIDKVSTVIGAAMKSGYERSEWMLSAYDTGEFLPIEATVVRVPWQDSYRVVVYATDLREVEARRREARETEERMRIMLDSMPLSCTFWDADGNLIDCNKKALEHFDCKNKQEYANNFFTLSPKYQPDGELSEKKAKALIRDTYENGQNNFVWEHITAKGHPLPVEVHMQRVKWEDTYRVIGYTRDMRKIRTLEDELIHMSSLVAASPNLAMYVKSDRSIAYMNPAVPDVSGFTEDEILSNGLAAIFDREKLDYLTDRYAPRLPERNRFDFEMDMICKNEKRLSFLVSVFTIISRDDTTDMGLTAIDITDMKRMREELVEAKLHAEQYSRAKSNFISRMSHEMRTPLNAITGMSGMVETADDARRKYCVEKINESAGRLLGMIDDVLDMAKIDLGHFELFAGECSFSDIMRSAVAAVSPLAEGKRQVFSAAADESIPDLLIVDGRRLRQVLVRLLSNAVKFTPENGEVRLSAKRLGDACGKGGKCKIQFEVQDSGMGISAERRERLWDIFEQEDDGITRAHDGMGMGLSISKRIIELMGGDIWVESEYGKGSLFVCTIEAEAVQSGASPQPDAKFSGAKRSDAKLSDANCPDVEFSGEDALSGADFSDCRILVVDDMEMNREIIMALLEGTGAAMDGAEDGSQAVRMFSENAYDLVLMDLHMPVMDGFETARHIRASGSPRAGSVRIIAVTADTGGDVAAACMDAGMNGHMGKPVAYEALIKAMSKQLPRNPARNSTRGPARNSA
jgi:PAS domain S-box-containing protein